MNIPALSWLLTYLFNALWQIPLVFAAAWIVVRIAHRSGPRAEHRIWVGALVLQIALPACNLRIAAVWHTLSTLLPAHGNFGSSGVQVFFGPAIAQGGGALRLPFAFEACILIAWACVTLYFAARLAWGLIETRRLARTAKPIAFSGEAAQRWNRHCQRFGLIAPSPQISISPHAVGPVAIGLRRGMVLVPPQLLDTVSPDDLNAVLAHELAHIARHDFAKNLLYTLLSLPIAWHPLLWRTRARLAESRELLCDDAAAEAVAGRKQYAQSLLRLASIFAGQPRIATLHAVGILDFRSNANTLERRVMTLTQKRIPVSAVRRILGAAACSILALATCTSALALHTDISDLAPDAQQSAAPNKLHVSAKEMSGNRISGDNPTYPPETKKKKIQGTVVIDATVSKEGAIEDLRVVKTPDPSLAESALKAVRTWRYRPYLRNGEPVEIETTINVTYNLAG
ncbi:MAG: M56 family metallopeptidase [Acidobacteriaceae bacterium]